MTDTPDAPAVAPSYRDNPTAPFVYFDGAPTFGVLGGAVQVELAARTITPGVVTVARLRCSPGAAESLLEALGKALDMLRKPDQAPAGTSIN